MTLRRFAALFIRTIASLAAIGVVVVLVLIALMRHERTTELDLPVPSGKFAVGRTILDWVNPEQTDELSPTKAKREVLVWIWYPAAVPLQATRADYLPSWWLDAYRRNFGCCSFVDHDATKVRDHSFVDAAVAPDRQNYPVVIFRAGLGALTTDYTTLIEDLASHGYIVAGFDAPHRTDPTIFPDGRVFTRPPESNPENFPASDEERIAEYLLPMWVSDMQFVVDQLGRLNAGDPQDRFTGRLDLLRLGLFGHSFGGAQSLQFCHDDSRCKAGIDIDGNPFGSAFREGVRQPFMFLIENMNISPPGSAEVLGKLRALYNRLPDSRLYVTVRGANHFSFSDQILTKTRYVVAPMLFLTGGLYQRRGLAITTDYVHAFFDVYLKDQPRGILEKLRQAYPEAQLPLNP